jgi:hypothetical protein
LSRKNLTKTIFALPARQRILEALGGVFDEYFEIVSLDPLRIIDRTCTE